MAEARRATRVSLRDRYEIAIDEPLPQYDNTPAVAYKVRHKKDSRRDLIGLVCDPKMPTRFELISPLSRIDNPYIMALQDWGIIDWPPEGRRCPVLIYEPPAGERVMASLEDTVEPMREEAIIGLLVNPLYQVLREFRDQDIVHRAIRPTNIFHGGAPGSRMVLGDCISSAPAVAQPFVLEPIESCMSTPIGRGVGSTADDLYALGVTILTLLTGHAPCVGMSDDEILDAKLSKGSYGALAQHTRISLTMMEALRGLLTDDPESRWTIEDLGMWANGRRGSPIQQSVETRAARSFPFKDRDHYTCRELAHTMSRNWDDAAGIIRDGTLDTWLRRALGDDVKVHAMNFAKTVPPDQDNDDNLIARACIALDPMAPVRFRDFRANVDGFPAMLAAFGQDNEMRADFLHIEQYSLLEFWDECQPRSRMELMQLYRDLKRARELIGRTNSGEGLERAIYELNPNQPCLSPLVEAYYVLDIEHLLPALEAVAESGEEVRQLVDRHIAAYIATHFSGNRGSSLRDLDNQADPYLPLLAAVRLLAQIQEKAGRIRPYPKLAALTAKLLEPAIKRFQNRQTRDQVARDLRDAAKTGRLSALLAVIDNADILEDDERRFQHAVMEYRDITNRLNRLALDRQNRTQIARELGAQVSSVVSGMLTTVAFLVIFVYTFVFKD